MTNDEFRMTNGMTRAECSWFSVRGLLLGMLLWMSVGALAFEVKNGTATVRVEGIEEAQWKELEGMLKDQLTLNGNGAVAEPLADDLAFFTRQFFIRGGWSEAEVKW